MAKTIDYDRVADLYDRYVRADLDVEFFTAEAKKAKGEVLELMAGTGRVSMPLAEAGIPLTCLDYSAGLLAVLREKLADAGKSLEVIEGDVRSFEIDRNFDLIFIALNAFSELTSTDDRKAALQRVHHHLTEDGRFILTLHNPKTRAPALDGKRCELGRFPLDDPNGELRVFFEAKLDPDTGLVEGRQLYRQTDSSGSLRSESELDLRFSLPDLEDVLGMLEAEGFRECERYGDYERGAFREDESPYLISILVKR